MAVSLQIIPTLWRFRQTTNAENKKEKESKPPVVPFSEASVIFIITVRDYNLKYLQILNTVLIISKKGGYI